jgi:hypothetical protein
MERQPFEAPLLVFDGGLGSAGGACFTGGVSGVCGGWLAGGAGFTADSGKERLAWVFSIFEFCIILKTFMGIFWFPVLQ